ncbi:MAG: FAD-dependent oxidoreductase [Rickettsiales bacterium]|nr:FAD-dependent oxidoreductase [Rickettsiales bacterium]
MATIHIIGAGIAGLTSALELLDHGHRICVYESAAQAGGRCRSYHDIMLDLTVDNGNHLILKSNQASWHLIEKIGATDHFIQAARFYPFIDAKYGHMWEWRSPYWLPKLPKADYLRLLTLANTSKQSVLTDHFSVHSELYRQFVAPLCISMLNTQPDEASARLFAGALFTIIKNGRDATPYLPKDNWQEAIITPLTNHLHAAGVEFYYQQALKEVQHDGQRITNCKFSRNDLIIAEEDMMILATPAQVSAKLLPDITFPDEYESIINIHYESSYDFPTGILSGVTNQLIDWLIAKPGILSTTTSAANHLIDTNNDSLAESVWKWIATQWELSEEVPNHRIVTEKRATFKATPENEAKRPDVQTSYHNLMLSGDYTNTKLPASIEGAIQSGHNAAKATLDRLQ